MNVNANEYTKFWEVLGSYNLMVHIPTEEEFIKKSKEMIEELDAEEAKCWFGQVTGG